MFIHCHCRQLENHFEMAIGLLLSIHFLRLSGSCSAVSEEYSLVQHDFLKTQHSFSMDMVFDWFLVDVLRTFMLLGAKARPTSKQGRRNCHHVHCCRPVRCWSFQNMGPSWYLPRSTLRTPNEFQNNARSHVQKS